MESEEVPKKYSAGGKMVTSGPSIPFEAFSKSKLML
jgi:hypothetical protein